MGEFGMQRTKIWHPEKEIIKSMFDTEGALQPMYLQYLDIPVIYQPNIAGMDFIEALAACKDVSLFENKSIQILITA